MTGLSRCTSPRPTALIWVDLVDERHPSVEELEQYLESLSEVSRLEITGRILELNRLATIGQVPGARQEFDRIARYPDLPIFELKWSHDVLGVVTLIRQYHAEPVDRADILVALHRHIKKQGSSAQVYPAQDAEIDFAQSRFEIGIKNGWDVPQYNL